MATAAPDREDRLDIREQIARIDRNAAETQKLFAETNRIAQGEMAKLFAETNRIAQGEIAKLLAETQKIKTDTRYHPLTLISTAAGAGAALFAAGAAFIKLLG